MKAQTLKQMQPLVLIFKYITGAQASILTHLKMTKHVLWHHNISSILLYAVCKGQSLLDKVSIHILSLVSSLLYTY